MGSNVLNLCLPRLEGNQTNIKKQVNRHILGDSHTPLPLNQAKIRVVGRQKISAQMTNLFGVWHSAIKCAQGIRLSAIRKSGAQILAHRTCRHH